YIYIAALLGRSSRILIPTFCRLSSRCCAHPLLLPFFFLMLPPPPRSTLFPYTTLFRSRPWRRGGPPRRRALRPARTRAPCRSKRSEEQRLNSSHLGISYAVFCLKKKKKKDKRNVNVHNLRGSRSPRHIYIIMTL